MKKRVLSLLLAGLLVASTGCGAATSSSSQSEDSGSNSSESTEETAEASSDTEETSDTSAFDGLPDKQEAGTTVAATPEMYSNVDLSKSVNINMYMVGDTPNDWEDVLAAVNEYLEPFNTTLSATFLSWSDYTTLYPLALQGDDCDIIYTASWCFYGSEVAKGSFHELTEDFLSTYMPLTTKYQEKESWAEVMVGDKIYCIPQNMSEATWKYVVIRKDLADKYGIGEITDWSDYMTYLETIAEKETPESGIYAYAAASENKELWNVYREQYDYRYLVENDFLCIGFENDVDTVPTVDDIQLAYDTDIFRDFCYDMKELADAGVWSRSALTATTTDDEAFAALQGASSAWNSSLFTYIATAELTDGVECAVYDLSPDVPTEVEYGTGGLAIAECSQNKERAAMILDIMENDTYINRLLTLGIEGVHYEMVDDTHYRELEKSSDYAIWCIAASWAIKNYKLVEDGMDSRREEMEEKIEARGVASPTRAFSFDDTQISDYTAAIKTVLTDYVPSLQLGLVSDVDASLQEMKEKLDAAGYQIYLEELQKQYEAWYAEQ